MLTIEQDGDVAVLNIDDGKANAVGFGFIEAVHTGLDHATAQAKAALIVGRPGRFCAGFDLSVIGQGGPEAMRLRDAGCEMLKAVFLHPQPVVIACTGHALAAGALLLLAADTRIGTVGDFKIGLNETAIGMSLPPFATALARERLSKRHLTAAAIQARIYEPSAAVDAGYLDEAVHPDALVERSRMVAKALAELPGDAYARTKQDLRRAVAERMTT